MSNLPIFLADFIERTDEARNVAELAGVPARRIDLSGSPQNVWYTILKHATKHGKLNDLIELIVQQYELEQLRPDIDAAVATFEDAIQSQGRLSLVPDRSVDEQKAVLDLDGYRTNLVKEFETFIPLGSDEPIRLENVYRDLAIYRQFQSPYYKSREQLVTELDISERTELLDRIRNDLDQHVKRVLGDFDSAMSPTPAPELKERRRTSSQLRDKRDRAVKALLEEEPLIAQLATLQGPEQLSDVLARRMSREILRSLLYDLGYEQGTLTKALEDLSDESARQPGVDSTSDVTTRERRLLQDILTKARRAPVDYLQAGDLDGAIAHWRDKIVDEIARFESHREKVTLDEAIRLWKSIVVLGHPGGGKTTLLHHKALVCARVAGGIVPIYVRLRDLNPSDPSTDTPKQLVQLVNDVLSGIGNEHFANNELDELLESGNVLFLFDGLDEVSEACRVSVAQQIERLCSRYPEVPSVVTCRILGYDNILQSHKPVELAELTTDQISSFIADWFQNVTGGADAALQLAQKSARLWRMLRNPFLLTMYCIARQRAGDRQFRRVELYEIATSALLEGREKQKGIRRQQFSRWQKESILRQIAAPLLEKAREYFTKSDVRSLLPTDDRNDVELMLDEIGSVSGIVRRLSNIDYGFSHLSLQEFYAALSYVERGVTPLPLCGRSRFWEMTRQYCGLLDPDASERFLNELLRETAEPDDWRFDAFICSCVTEMRSAPPHILTSVAERVVARYLAHSSDRDAEAVLLEHLVDLTERDSTGALDPIFERLIWAGEQSLSFAANTLLSAGVSTKQRLLEQALQTLPHHQAETLVGQTARHISPTSIDLLWVALGGEAHATALRLMCSIAGSLHIDVSPKLEAIANAPARLVSRSNRPKFYMRLSPEIPPRVYYNVEMMFDRYFAHVKAYAMREKLKNHFTGQYEEPYESIMRQMERRLDIPENRKDDFRREVLNAIGAAAVDDRAFAVSETRLKPVVFEALDAAESIPCAYKFHCQWQPPSPDLEEIESGIIVDSSVLFPGVTRIRVHELLLEACTTSFQPSILKLAFSSIPAAFADDLVRVLAKGLVGYSSRAMRYKVSYESYKLRMGPAASAVIDELRASARPFAEDLYREKELISHFSQLHDSVLSEAERVLVSMALKDDETNLPVDDPMWQRIYGYDV